MIRALYKGLYHSLIALTRVVGPVRPRRVYDWLGRRAFDRAEFQWFTNRWGDELLLSHFYHIDRNILAFGTYDLELHLALERLLEPGMIVFDVGANLGEMALHMARRVGPGGQVWAFEPVMAIHARLRGHIERNRAGEIVRAMEVALSDVTGEATIAAPDERADNQGLASIANVSEKSGPVRTTIRTMTLDDFVQEHGIERIDLMKIDIQGAEPKFLAGGRRTLERMGPDLLMEFSPEDLRASGLTSRDLAKQLGELGYRIHPLTREGFGAPIDAEKIGAEFAATNVLCRRKKNAGPRAG